ncbi:MAG: hypothetical protein KF841_08050 [Phycisphaerae bacterium]|nr:hypothetical protein [Phycisphaerae bacterium]
MSFGMDALTSSIVAMNLAETTASIQYAVAAKLLRSEQAVGDTALKLIEAASRNFDAKIAQVSAAIDSTLDTYA